MALSTGFRSNVMISQSCFVFQSSITLQSKCFIRGTVVILNLGSPLILGEQICKIPSCLRKLVPPVLGICKYITFKFFLTVGKGFGTKLCLKVIIFEVTTQTTKNEYKIYSIFYIQIYILLKFLLLSQFRGKLLVKLFQKRFFRRPCSYWGWFDWDDWSGFKLSWQRLYLYLYGFATWHGQWNQTVVVQQQNNK